MRTSEKVYFENRAGIRLCGIIDHDDAQTRAVALFSHCFTCTKDLKAIVRIGRRLAEFGIAVLRFDFTGLGDSSGSFSDSSFDSNCDDVRSAIEFIQQKLGPPKLLIGHSLGGAAMMKVASEYESVRALTTIASPASTRHLADYLQNTNPEIVEKGEGEVEIGGRTYLLKRHLIENLRDQDLPAMLASLSVPHLIFHPLEDTTLPYWHAEKMLQTTGGPGSLITLDRSDHLLVERDGEANFVAEMIELWFRRLLSGS